MELIKITQVSFHMELNGLTTPSFRAQTSSTGIFIALPDGITLTEEMIQELKDKLKPLFKELTINSMKGKKKTDG